MRGDGITVKSIAVASRRPRPTGVGGSPPPAIAPGNQTFRRKTWPEAAPVLVYRKFSIPKLDDVNPKLDEFRQQDGAAPGRVRPGRQVLPQRRFRFPSSPPHATKNGGPHRHLPTKSRRWARGDRFASLPYLHEGMYGTWGLGGTTVPALTVPRDGTSRVKYVSWIVRLVFASRN